MLSEDEIKKVKDGIVILTIEEILQTLATGKIKIINPTMLNNGYVVGYSIEHIRPDLIIHHISVSNTKGLADPADAEHIARDILGKEYKSIGPMNLKNVLHFMKFISKNK